MKTKILVILCIFSVFSTGCASVNVKKNLITLDENFFSDDKDKIALSSSGENMKLEAAYRQVTNPNFKSTDYVKFTQKSLEAHNIENPLPSYLVNEPLIRKIVITAREALVKERTTELDITKDDISSMTRMLNHNFRAMSSDNLTKASITAVDSTKETHKRLLSYLSAYYSGEKGFVNREGTVFKRPEIKYSIGNDVITAVVAISLECLLDSLVHTPVYIIEKGGETKFQTIGGAQPSFDLYETRDNKPPVYRTPIVEQGNPGIEAGELKAIRFLSGLAGDQSKTISGAAYRAIGGVDFGFVLLGKFSFGDNDTLAKILDTAFEIASKRIVEEGAYRGFMKLTSKDGSNVQQALTNNMTESTGMPSKAKLLLQQMD